MIVNSNCVIRVNYLTPINGSCSCPCSPIEDNIECTSFIFNKNYYGKEIIKTEFPILAGYRDKSSSVRYLFDIWEREE